jgi:uncharacterized membrane protein
METFFKRSGIGDAGLPNDDGSYTGADATSATSVQYYRDQATKFQETLNAFDTALTSAENLLAAGDISPDLMRDLRQMLIDADSKKTQMRLTAEAINAAAAAINAAGGRFPEISVPSGLGFVPVLIPAAALAAFAAIAGLTYFASQWIKGYNERLKREQLISSASGGNRDAIVQAIAESDNAVAAMESQGLFGGSSSIASIAKWLAIAGMAYFAWRAWEKRGD